MKLKLVLLFLLVAGFSHATVIVVDNNGNAPAGVETSLSTAIINATAGDTLLVIPSSSTYGNISISKALTIIGVGFNPNMDIPFTSIIGNTTILTAASGTKLIGLEMTGYLRFGNTGGTLSDIVIENNRINYIDHSGINSLVNVIIRQNVIRASSAGIFNVSLSVANQSNIIIANNIFSYGTSGSTQYGPYILTGGVTFDHNTFMGASSQSAFYDVRNCLVTNNIFVTVDPGPRQPTAVNLFYRNNLSNSVGEFATMNGSNITLDSNIEDDPVFQNLPLNTITYTYDLDPTLLTGPGENGATDGTNVGADGGTSPFKLSGSILPVVKRFDLPSNIIEGNNADATIEVTGN